MNSRATHAVKKNVGYFKNDYCSLLPFIFPTPNKYSTLAYEEILAPSSINKDHNFVKSDDEARSTVLVIHGLFGTGRNWRTPIKNLATAVGKKSNDNWRFVLVDLRNHGRSAQLEGFSGPHSVKSAAMDLVELVQKSKWASVPVVIGHSLGGKVALEYSKTVAALDVDKPKQVWILDSVPGPVVQHGKGDVEKVIETLKSLPKVVQSRKWLIGHLQDIGYSRGLAEWIASNLQKINSDSKSEEMTWVFNVEEAAEMYESYKSANYLDMLKNPPAHMQLDFVKAEKSDRWYPETLDPLEAATKSFAGKIPNNVQGTVKLHVLPNAGHWLHMDNPQGLIDLMAPSFTARNW